MEQAKRFNENKIRLDLIPSCLNKEVGKILTFGSIKYGDNNWRKGMEWSKCIASLKRHLLDFEEGIDYDNESRELHISHLIVNAMFILEYYKTHPEFDDRPHLYLNRPKIGLDIDEVLCDWVGAWTKKFGYPIPRNWSFSYNNKNEFNSFSEDELKEFYLNIPRKVSPDEIPFEPHCYITSRSVPVEITKEWLRINGYACAPVYSLGWGESKVEIAKQSGIDIFVDDRFENFIQLNKAGICTYLLSAPHNERYNVGHKRIKSLKELI